MKKQKKYFLLLCITLTIATIILFANEKIYANNNTDLIQKLEYSEDYKKWLELSNEEKEKVIMPRIYDIPYSKTENKNPLLKVRLLKAGLSSRYSLKDTIPENLSIRNQKQTNSCWAFASLSSLETNLALDDYKNEIKNPVVYDFSERHMEYATSRNFLDGNVNNKGYNRKVGDGGNWYISTSYLTNGSGAILEPGMPFENNEDMIDISQIQNKTVASQVYDTVDFPDYRNKNAEEKIEIMNKIKDHIRNYGAVQASIHGNSSNVSSLSCYNNDTGAKYCDNAVMHSYDHAISIIGWDDNYGIENYCEASKPESNGAWIVRNSWGKNAEEWNLSELKEAIFNQFEGQCIQKGWNSAEQIPNEFIQQAGYTIENNIAYIKYGDNGIIYISYEDVNISKEMYGIVKAKDKLDYDNIYQYDVFSPAMHLSLNKSKVMLCNIFNKKTTSTEYLTQISLYAPETYTCKVYVNPNGSSKSKNDLQQITLKAGESETIEPGYHTLEFARPIEINGNTFAVVVEIQGSNSSIKVPLECIVSEVKAWDYVTVENEKCFITIENDLDNAQWIDLGKIKGLNSSLPNGDSTIKAFTTNTLLDNSLTNIEIVTPPTKTSYFEGEKFDTTGMVVRANYNSKTTPYVILNDSDYTITNGNNLKTTQSSVTITFEDKNIEQPITVEKNSIVELKIKTPPTNTNYKEGQNFDKSGLVIEAVYKNGEVKTVTDYEIKNGNNLQADQTEVVISYGEKEVVVNITVTPNKLQEIRITKAPNKVKYVVGQNFDTTGMEVSGIYEDESTQEIKDYTIENGNNLTKEQTSVIIKFREKTVSQLITVEEKSITSLSISKKPSKLVYIQNKEELDLTGGILKVEYNDETTEDIELNSNEISVTGFDNSKLGKQNITINYQNKTAQFEIDIIEESKAKNSNFDNIKCDVKGVKAYYYKNDSSRDYTLINVEVNQFSKNLENDSLEYYYYLSTNKEETGITNWVKITEEQDNSDKLQFTIDSRKIANYNDLLSDNVLYLYIKEVATKGDNQSSAISKAMNIETNKNIETYVDDKKKENLEFNEANEDNKDKDDTIATKELPNTGARVLTIVVIIITLLGIAFYIRYKNLAKYVK